MPSDCELRREIDRLVTDGGPVDAMNAMRCLWRAEPTMAAGSFITSRYERLLPALLSCQSPPAKLHLMILRSFTVEPLVPLLRAGAALAGIDLRVTIGGFNCYAHEILDSKSLVYTGEPDVVLLAVRTEDIAPKLWSGFADLSGHQVDDEVGGVVKTFRSLTTALRQYSQAPFLIHTLESPAWPTHGVLDVTDIPSQTGAIQDINGDLDWGVARKHSGVYLVDYDGLVARHGRVGWHDAAKYHAARMPIAADCLVHLANEWLRYLVPLSGRIAKCLVLDLDNTLWGGVIGEDGVDGIHITPDFLAVQRAALDLYGRGILLAICSKNNQDDAFAAFVERPEMLLRHEHFAAIRINWQDKAQNLREIAAELNIGTDTLAFLDDSPAERALIRTSMPEVLVVEPGDDAATAIRACPQFERLALTQEDRERGRYYAEHRERVAAEHSATSLEDYYRSLQMVVEIGVIGPTTDVATQQRVAQLTQRTNQFNLTTRRYTKQQTSQMAGDGRHTVYWCRLRDRFGDQGIVGAAIAQKVMGGMTWNIDTLLLSCRAIGRGVETAMLSAIVQDARASGALAILGEFFPTAKNHLAADFYRFSGFTTRDAGGWELDLRTGRVESPSWIECCLLNGEATR